MQQARIVLHITAPDTDVLERLGASVAQACEDVLPGLGKVEVFHGANGVINQQFSVEAPSIVAARTAAEQAAAVAEAEPEQQEPDITPAPEGTAFVDPEPQPQTTEELPQAAGDAAAEPVAVGQADGDVGAAAPAVVAE